MIGVVKREVTLEAMKIMKIDKVLWSNRNKWQWILISSDNYFTKDKGLIMDEERISRIKDLMIPFRHKHYYSPEMKGSYSIKAVLPALAGVESVLSNHNWQMIAHPQATWGVCEGNPIWQEMREVALLTEPDFLLNVALNADQEITAVFAGDLLEAHRTGREFVRRQAMAAVDEPYDIVITTNSGYPLDQNLYQTYCQKGT